MLKMFEETMIQLTGGESVETARGFKTRYP